MNNIIINNNNSKMEELRKENEELRSVIRDILYWRRSQFNKSKNIYEVKDSFSKLKVEHLPYRLVVGDGSTSASIMEEYSSDED